MLNRAKRISQWLLLNRNSFSPIEILDSFSWRNYYSNIGDRRCEVFLIHTRNEKQAWKSLSDMYMATELPILSTW